MPEASHNERDSHGGPRDERDIEQETDRSQPHDLISYDRTRQGCVRDLRRLLVLATKNDINRSILELTEDVLKRTESKCFSIAVVGEFKRGKSTFINALLGCEILPADIRPCSATLNRVTYGEQPRVSIYYKSGNGEERRVEEIAIDQLGDYVTKLTPEAAEKAAEIDEAVIHYPTEYCRYNVDIIDTPGLNDNQTMTAVTMSVIPRVDAAILVIMPESPFSGYEGEFLTKHLLLHDLGRVMFVVTAIDRLRKPKDREGIVDVIEERIAEAVEARLTEQFAPDSEEFQRYRQQIGRPTVFPLSAQIALEAQQSKDDKLLADSQFTRFTSALERFLTHTRGVIELQVLANRILTTGDEIVKKIDIETGALNMEQQQFQAGYEASLAQLDTLRTRRDMEIRKIDEAVARTWQRLEPMVVRLGDELKRDAVAAIETAEITAADLVKDKVPELTNRLSGRVSEAVRLRGQRWGEALKLEIERDVQTEIERLHDFATTVGSTLQGIGTRFGTVQVDGSPDKSVGSESLVAALSMLTGCYGIWSGYREAGAKGATLGGVTSVGTYFAFGALVAAMSIPVSVPIIVSLIIVSIFSGGWAAKRAFGADRVGRFTEQYRAAILERIDAGLRERDLSGTVKGNVEEVYKAVKAKLMSEVTASIDQTQSTLDGLRNRRARDEALSEQRGQELAETRQEVLAIRSKAIRLANQLREVTDD